MRDSPIFGFNEARSEIVEQVVKRVAEGTKNPLHALNEAAYLEIRRLKHGPEWAEWRALAGSLGKMTEEQLKDKLAELVQKYGWDVAGNFNPRVYNIATKAMPPLLGTLLSPRAAVRNIGRLTHLSALDDRIVVQGPIDRIRKLCKLGTVVFVPTHLSNLDSVVFGFALERSDLPPATYGAGKNLFTNPVLSFFMHNLGAYRVDRRLKHGLYKDVLKAYSCVLIERGYHSLFFPGGTRSRSGGVERKLKLGLAGTALEAFIRTAMAGKPQKVFFVPATINYLLTLEAETLIEDFLQDEGKHRYIIEDDESTRVGRIAAFVQKLFGLGDSVVIRFSSPLDCFGNEVDEDGNSQDSRGRPIDALGYVMGQKDEIRWDPARDAQYTRELGDVICKHYKKDTVVMATHLVATVGFERLRRWCGKGEIFGILANKDSVVVPRKDLLADLDQLMGRVRDAESRGQLVLAPSIAKRDAATVLDEALRAMSGYHSNAAIEPQGSNLVLTNTQLLFYYQNRLAAHGLAFDAIAPRPSARAAESARVS
jgi:glycerol-3-phosphate O-acyltransferase